MKTSKLFMTVMVLAVLSAGLTIFYKNQGFPRVMEDRITMESPEMMVTEPAMPSYAPDMDMGMKAMPIPDPGYDYYYGDDALDMMDRSYTNSSNFQLVVDDVSSYINQMKEFIASVEGVVLSVSINTTEDYGYGYLYAKVPATQFDQTNSKLIEGVEGIISQNINIDDITGQVVNAEELVQRLTDQREVLEAQLAEARAQGASSVEILKIQQQIDRVTAQIDSAQNQEQAIDNQVQYASINVSAADSSKFFLGYDYNPTFWEEVKEAARSLGGSLGALLRFAAWVIVYSVIWLPILVVFNRTRAKVGN